MLQQVGDTAAFGWGKWGAFSGPISTNASAPIPQQFNGLMIEGKNENGGDVYFAPDVNHNGSYALCWFQPGTANLVGYGYAQPNPGNGG
jgi:hypothetical protein